MIYFTEKKYYSSNALRIYKKIAPISKKITKSVKVLVVRLSYNIDKKFLKKFKSLKFIISNTTGLDHIEKKFCNDNNIKILSLNNTKEKILPIVYSQSAMSKNLISNQVKCRVIFKNDFDMSLIEVKSIIEKFSFLELMARKTKKED